MKNRHWLKYFYCDRVSIVSWRSVVAVTEWTNIELVVLYIYLFVLSELPILCRLWEHILCDDLCCSLEYSVILSHQMWLCNCFYLIVDGRHCSLRDHTLSDPGVIRGSRSTMSLLMEHMLELFQNIITSMNSASKFRLNLNFWTNLCNWTMTIIVKSNHWLFFMRRCTRYSNEEILITKFHTFFSLDMNYE